MISIIITSFKEPKTIGKAIESFLNQKIKEKYEIIVSAPDEETLRVAKKYARKNKKIKLLKDSGKGKPSALNSIFKKAKGDILVLSDGDVFAGKNSMKYLLSHFQNKQVGAVTGKPVPANSKENLFGYWAFLATEAVHNSRLKDAKQGQDILCSGYLYAIRSKIVSHVPENILADDAYISLEISKKGYKTLYEPKAEVHVAYPDNLPDWIRQKKRTAAKFYQLNQYFKISKVISFKEELASGFTVLKNIISFRHVFYFILLGIMRAYIWFRVFFDFRLWKREFKKTWQRVESTK